MKPRNTLIIVALFALLAGYVYFVEMNKTEEQLSPHTPTAPAPMVFQFKPGDVTSIEVRDLQFPRETKMTRTESGWQVNKPAERAGNKSMIDSALETLSNLQASRVLTNVTDLAPFGLVTGTIELRFIMSDTTQYALTLGDKTPDGGSVYATYTGGKQVFIVTSNVENSMNIWLANPPFEPPPTATPTPLATPTAEAAEAGTATPAAAPPGIVPTLVPTVATTPKP